MEDKRQNYRGVKPVEIVSVLEGNGKDIPFKVVEYVIGYEETAGVTRMKTLGKIVPLTEEERKWF